ncbi:uncharacterized protein LOC113279249 [Papaver somniferum]|uniref:uncharacterized protein LOC113279249 n=1 Tax=Papaver somniferum TaxID=3469 RepID=UPI000E6F71DD|nr:uncharacterized protein LOC113279249 [Papaver somniferum]
MAIMIQLLEEFAMMLHNNEKEDDRKYKFAPDFTVASCYSSLEVDGFLAFPHKQIWNPKIPLKVSFLAWTLFHDGAPSLEFLQRVGKVNSSTCLLCNTEQETQSHLFLHCSETRKVWHYFLDSFGVKWVFSENVKSNLWEWKAKKNRSMIKKIWSILPFAIWWTIWRERNYRVFNNKRRYLGQLIVTVKYTQFNWSLHTKIFEGYSLSTLICNWEAVIGNN